MESTHQVQPLVVDSKGASVIDNLSPSWHNNTRLTDAKRNEQGLPPKGPPYFYIGRKVVYEVEALRKWLDSIRDGTNPAYQDAA